MAEFEVLGLSALLQAFLAGLAVSLTPCVYPLIPITLSLFNTQKSQSRSRSFALSACYVLGLSTTYTILGIVSALGGAVFGGLLASPYVVLSICILLFLMACASLDIFSSAMFTSIQNKASKIGGQGFKGAFLMGTVSAIVAAPCVGPALVAILSLVALNGSLFVGALLLFSYSLGFGMLFLVLGLSPALLRKLPRSGSWLLFIKFILSIGLLLTAVFLSQRYYFSALPDLLIVKGFVTALVFVVGIIITIFAFKRQLKALKLLAALVISMALAPVLFSTDVAANNLNWHTTIASALQYNKQQITMVDFYADWCAACKELEHLTFSDPRVIAEISKLNLARIDFTEPDDMLAEKYGITGLPCILFLDNRGSEIQNSRINGFMNASDFLEHLQIVKTVAIRQNQSLNVTSQHDL